MHARELKAYDLDGAHSDEWSRSSKKLCLAQVQGKPRSAAQINGKKGYLTTIA